MGKQAYGDRLSTDIAIDDMALDTTRVGCITQWRLGRRCRGGSPLC